MFAELASPDALALRNAAPRCQSPVLARRERLTQLTLGMPELNACGLSETSLQRTCGSQHWHSLSQALGVPSEQWRDVQGRRVYAAFGWIHMHAARLDLVREGQLLRFDSRLHWLGRSQAWSRHQLAIGHQGIAHVDMMSVFVSRHSPSGNHAVRRADMPDGVVDVPSAETSVLLAHLRSWRNAAETRSPEGLSWRATPCPRSDFNGAGLLYFPTFTALADRALWDWGRLGPREQVQSRECLFLGKISLGESVQVNLIDDRPTADGRRILLQLVSADADARRLAEVRMNVCGPH